MLFMIVLPLGDKAIVTLANSWNPLYSAFPDPSHTNLILSATFFS